jgi:folate-binding protein YgfZ
MTQEAAPDRTVLRIAGDDARDFLQGLVTNHLPDQNTPAVYAALLSPQGKYLADFFLIADGDAILLDIKADLAAGVARRLGMYRLRAKVTIEPATLLVTRGLGPTPPGAIADPRHPALGWRHYGQTAGGPPSIDWDALRVAHVIPETGVELIPDESYILEMGFERLNGVDFRKGCYVGQEVTARMKHKTELRKGLVQVAVDGLVPVGTPITANDKVVGRLFTQSEGIGLAYLRFDRAQDLQAGSAALRMI